MGNNRFQIALVVLVLVGFVVGGYFTLNHKDNAKPEPTPEPVVTQESEPEPAFAQSVIGQSVDGRAIVATTFGRGDTHLLFVGGMHGGYEWNSSLLAYEMIDHLTKNPDLIPNDLTVSIIPDLNPDATFKVTGKVGPFTATDITDPSVRVAEARFNTNGVDLNRNFDCKWAPTSTWKGRPVSAGSSTFSEPEAIALRDFVTSYQPKAVVFWHSKAGNVYASECENGVLPETLVLMKTYAEAANYGQVPVFDAYPITGDAEGWLASLGIPAVTVELETADSIEWNRNVAGVEALLAHYSKNEAEAAR